MLGVDGKWGVQAGTHRQGIVHAELLMRDANIIVDKTMWRGRHFDFCRRNISITLTISNEHSEPPFITVSYRYVFIYF